MYTSFCPSDLPVGLCFDGDPYLLTDKCDGHGDCAFGRPDPDNSDETNCPVTTIGLLHNIL